MNDKESFEKALEDFFEHIEEEFQNQTSSSQNLTDAL